MSFGNSFPRKMKPEEIEAVKVRALEKAKSRSDCDIDPIVKYVDFETHIASDTEFCSIDVQYSSKGYCALYEFNHRTGQLVLAQD